MNNRKKYHKEYYLKNKDKILVQSQIYYENNKEDYAKTRRKYRLENKAKEQQRHKIYFEQNKEKIQYYQREWYKANKARVNAQGKIWHANNKDGHKARIAKYCAKKLKATPNWSDLNKIKQVYSDCPVGYEVDHIVPLQGKNVCGLHVSYNLQYLTISENRSKGNRLENG